METYKPALLIWMEKMFKHARERQWFETYHCFDVHGVISNPDYRKTEKVGKEFKINYYPWAKETLQYLTKNRPDMILFIYTSSYKKEIERYMEQFKKDGIHFKYVNENPEISDAKGSFGCYDKKPYWNSIWEDKAGFDPEIDWKSFYDYFTTSDYKPDPSWSFKSDESYHEKIKPISYKDLTDEQLIEFAKLRIDNSPEWKSYGRLYYEKHVNKKITIKKITIEDKHNYDYFCVSFIVKTKEFADERLPIQFDRFYPNEISYLIKCGINFEML
jgi:hypothetical protein